MNIEPFQLHSAWTELINEDAVNAPSTQIGPLLYQPPLLPFVSVSYSQVLIPLMNTSGDRLFPGCPVEDVEGYVGEISNAIPTVVGEETNLWVQTNFISVNENGQFICILPCGIH